MGGENRQATEALDAAEAGGALDQLKTVERSAGGPLAAQQVHAYHAPESGHLPLRDGVILVRRKARVVHARHPWMPFERRGHGHRGDVVALHPDLERLERSSKPVGRCGIEHPPELPPGYFDWANQLTSSGHHARGHVAVAVQVLRRALHGEVNAHLERSLVNGARKRVVDDARHVPCATRLGNAFNVHASQMRVNRRLEPEDARPLRDGLLGSGQLIETKKPAVNPEPWQQVVQ